MPQAKEIDVDLLFAEDDDLEQQNDENRHSSLLDEIIISNLARASQESGQLQASAVDVDELTVAWSRKADFMFTFHP